MAQRNTVSIPVYKEGYTNPMTPTQQTANPWSTPAPAYQPSTLTAMPTAFKDDAFFQQHQREMERIWTDMHGRMREMEQLFPWHLPGQFRPGVEPSALAPQVDERNYSVEVQASDYKPNEITVKTVNRQGHNFLVVEGKHETNDPHGYHSVHHFKRQYMIPQNVDPESFSSKLDANGKLYVQAPVRQAADGGDARTIPVLRQ